MNLLDYFREELNKCQNINQISKLRAVINHLCVERAIELEASERAIANQFRVSNTVINRIKKSKQDKENQE